MKAIGENEDGGKQLSTFPKGFIFFTSTFNQFFSLLFGLVFSFLLVFFPALTRGLIS